MGRSYSAVGATNSLERFIRYHKTKIQWNKLCSDYALTLFSLSLPERFS